MLLILLTILITYAVVSLFGYFVHKALHQPWTGKFNTSHMAHHVKLYPSGDFLSEEYRDAGKDDTFWTFAIVSLPIIFTPIILFLLGLSLHLTIISVIEMLLIGWLNNFIHSCMHIRDHWLSRLPIIKFFFVRWRRLHELHHDDMQKNFGIFSFNWDRIFKTYWNGKL